MCLCSRNVEISITMIGTRASVTFADATMNATLIEPQGTVWFACNIVDDEKNQDRREREGGGENFSADDIHSCDA